MKIIITLVVTTLNCILWGASSNDEAQDRKAEANGALNINARCPDYTDSPPSVNYTITPRPNANNSLEHSPLPINPPLPFNSRNLNPDLSGNMPDFNLDSALPMRTSGVNTPIHQMIPLQPNNLQNHTIIEALSDSSPDEGTIRKALKKYGLTKTDLQAIKNALAKEHLNETTKTLKLRGLCSDGAQYLEWIGMFTGYLAIISSPLAGATLLIESNKASEPIIFIGSICAIVKIFCMSLAKYMASEASEYHKKLDDLINHTGLKTVDIVPIINDPSERK